MRRLDPGLRGVVTQAVPAIRRRQVRHVTQATAGPWSVLRRCASDRPAPVPAKAPR